MSFMEKFVLSLSYFIKFILSRLGVNFKIFSLFKKIGGFHVQFRQGGLVYLYIMFYIFRLFFITSNKN